MNEFFLKSENLYRSVYPQKEFIREDNTLTSAAFKIKNGLSVDRQGMRTDQESIEFARSHLSGNIYSVTVADCEDVGVLVKYRPEDDNPYHSEIHHSEDKSELTKSEAKKLSKLAKLKYERKKMQD